MTAGPFLAAHRFGACSFHHHSIPEDVRLCTSIWSLLAAAPLPLCAQSVLSGNVREAGSAAPVPAVQVHIPELHLGTLSDSAGHFALTVRLAGLFTVQFSRLGYEQAFQQVELRPDSVTQVDVVLQQGLLELRDVNVVGTQVSDPRSTSRAVSTLSVDEMRERGALSLGDAVAKLPGVAQLTTGAGISKPVIRGLSGNRVQVNVLGQRFDNQQWQDEHGLGLSDLGVDRVQVIKGPAALQYGSDAIGGVLNVLEEKPAPVGTTEQQARLGLMSNTGGLTAAYGIRSTSTRRWWRLTAGAEDHADYAAAADARVRNSRFAMYNAKAGLGWNRGHWNSANHVHVSFSRFGFVFDTLERTTPDARYSRTFNGPYHQVGFVVLGSENTWHGARTKWNVNAGISVNRRQEQEGGDRISLDMLLGSASALVQSTTRMRDDASWSNGLSLLLQRNTNFGSRIIIPDAGVQEAGIFSYYRRRSGKATVEGGLRFDDRRIRTFSTLNLNPPTSPVAPFDRNWTALNGSLGLAWDPMVPLNVKAHVSSGYRSGNLAELGSNGLHEGTFRYEVGDPQLRVEQNLCAELGFTWRWREQVEVTATAFRNRFFDYIHLVPTGTEYLGFPIHRFEQQGALLTGGEAGLDVHPKVLRHWGLTCSYATVRGRTDDGAALPFMPADRLRAELAWNPRPDAWLRFGVVQVAAQDRPARFERASPAYTLYNLSAGFVLHGAEHPLKVSLFCNNITDVRYVDHLSRFKYLGLLDMGRNVGIALQLSLRSNAAPPRPAITRP